MAGFQEEEEEEEEKKAGRGDGTRAIPLEALTPSHSFSLIT